MTSNQGGVRSRVGGETAAAVHHTSTRIWVCVAVIILGFVIGGVSFPLHSILLLIIGLVVIAIGGVAALAFGIMDNVH